MSAAVRVILPIACAWAKRQESWILKTGVPLSEPHREIAKRLGITHPGRIRLSAVPRVPPLNRLVRIAGQKLGIVSDGTIGMTLRYGIFLREDEWGNLRLLVHELAHVSQYERMGGFYAFLRQYLEECIKPGYPFGELEMEAKRAELTYG